MKLLYQNSNRIVDKYQIVKDVGGDEGLREVDDARIEKLVSRLRQKVEPDAANPVYITTVRGRDTGWLQTERAQLMQIPNETKSLRIAAERARRWQSQDTAHARSLGLK